MSENSLPLSLVRPEELMEELGIKKDSYYRDIRFLNIKPIRDEKGKVWLTPEDAERIKHLRSYVEKNGKRKGFSEIIKSDNKAHRFSDSCEMKEGALSVNSVSAASVTTSNSSSSLVQEDIYVQPSPLTEQFEVNGLMRSAAELKAREVAMPDLIKRAIADQMTEDELPSDLKEKVKNAREAANPSFTPTEVASKLLSQWRAGKGG